MPDLVAKPTAGRGRILALVAVGGAIGALLRYQCALLWPTPSGQFPWTTLLVNITGCLAMGAFMTWVLPRTSALLRPFIATGILGGFTTFSTYSVEVDHLLRVGDPGTALAYLAVTASTTVAGTVLGIVIMRGTGRRRG